MLVSCINAQTSYKFFIDISINFQYLLLGVCGFPNSPVPELRVGPGFFRVGSGRSSGIPEKFPRSTGTVFKSEISLALWLHESYAGNFSFALKKEEK